MSKQYPPVFARFYDLLYAKIVPGGSDYYLKVIRESKGPVMEAGTGTGRIFIEALAQGTDIYGIDISPAMLDILRSKINSNEHYRISLQDIKDFSINMKFNLIIAPFRVFMHLNDVADQRMALDHVYHSLEPGGTFIFDVFIPNAKYLAEGVDDMVDFDEEYIPGETLRRITSAQYDLVNQIIQLNMRFEWTEKGVLHSKLWNSTMRLFFRYELEHLLSLSKFKRTNIYGDFHESSLTSDSKEFVVVCRK